jgi:hypothetical protein
VVAVDSIIVRTVIDNVAIVNIIIDVVNAIITAGISTTATVYTTVATTVAITFISTTAIVVTAFIVLTVTLPGADATGAGLPLIFLSNCLQPGPQPASLLTLFPSGPLLLLLPMLSL